MKHSILKKWVLLIAFLMTGWSAMAQFSGGNGIARKPYQIANLTLI